MIAFGTYQLTPEEATIYVEEAILAGIKQIDTAQLYKNELETCRVVEKYPDVFLTSKIHKKLIKNADKDNRAIENSIQYVVDCILLHMPEKNYEIAWEQLKRTGKIIGVSNFNPEQIQSLSSKPYINQIEVTPYNLCSRTVEYCKKEGILISAHSALTKGMQFADLSACSKLLNMTPAQFLINWSLTQDYMPIFRSRNSTHIRQICDTPRASVYYRTDTKFRTHMQYTLD